MITFILKLIWQDIQGFLSLAAKLMEKAYPNEALKSPETSSTAEPADISNITQSSPTEPISASSTLSWDSQRHSYHSVRVICDDMGLDFATKNELCATIMGESEFKTGIVHPNYVLKNGIKTVSTTDYGICQWNDYWHGKEISPDDALHNPEKAVRLMCSYFKRGDKNTWCAHSNGSYKQYLDQTHLQSLLA